MGREKGQGGELKGLLSVGCCVSKGREEWTRGRVERTGQRESDQGQEGGKKAIWRDELCMEICSFFLKMNQCAQCL